MPQYNPLGGFTDYDSNTVLVTANIVLTTGQNGNQDYYDGQILEFSGAFSITLPVGLKQGFGFSLIPPAAGNASIVSDGTVLLNGATTTVTRAAAANALCALVQRASANNSYVINGS